MTTFSSHILRTLLSLVLFQKSCWPGFLLIMIISRLIEKFQTPKLEKFLILFKRPLKQFICWKEEELQKLQATGGVSKKKRQQKPKYKQTIIDEDSDEQTKSKAMGGDSFFMKMIRYILLKSLLRLLNLLPLPKF